MSQGNGSAYHKLDRGVNVVLDGKLRWVITHHKVTEVPLVVFRCSS